MLKTDKKIQNYKIRISRKPSINLVERLQTDAFCNETIIIRHKSNSKYEARLTGNTVFLFHFQKAKKKVLLIHLPT